MREQQTKLLKLREAIEAPNGLLAHRHRDFIEAARRSHSHTIAYRESVDESTCVTYTLALFRDRTYRAIAGRFQQIFAGRQFIDWLLEKGLLFEEIPTSEPGCVVLYFEQGVWKHIGAMLDGKRAVSKWGTFPVYEHAIFEVPVSYGDTVRYFRVSRPDHALELFIEFSKSQFGISDADIARAVYISNLYS